MSDLEPRLRVALDEHAAMPGRPAPWDDVVRRGRRRRAVRQAQTAGALTAVLAVLLAGAALARRGDDSTGVVQQPSPSPSIEGAGTPTPTPTPTPTATGGPGPAVDAVRVSADLRHIVIPLSAACDARTGVTVAEPAGGDVQITLVPSGAAVPAACVGDPFGSSVTVAIRPIGDRNVFVNRRRTRVVPSELLLTASTLPEGFQTSRFEYPLPAQGGELGYGFRWSAGDYQLTVHHDGPVVQCAGARSVRIRSTVGSVCGRDRDPSSDLVATWSEHGHRISVQIGPMGLPDVDPYEMADLLGVVEALVPAT